MMGPWLKALLFVAGGVTAAAGTAYVTGLLDPWLGREQAAIAALPGDSSSPSPEAPAGDGAESPAAGAEVPQPDEPAATGKGSRLVTPTFHLLRVEPDGSVVIAGNAGSQSTVEILSGDNVIASADADLGGDFIAVLDEPLAPGDYQLSLRATAGDVVSSSAQTATVSIPEVADGQVLAMVEEPGAPSRLITVPDAQAGGDAPQAGEQPADATVAAEPPSTAVDQDTAEAPEPGAAADGDVAAVGEDAERVQAEGEASAGAEVAAAPPAAETGDAQPAQGGVVVVEAVEIEGDTIYVAGVAEPGRTVRVYADDMLLGDAKASEGGRFLVEAQRSLPVGDYVIRADLLADDGSVVARAAVPFEREPGESIAAVAPPASPQQADQPAGQEQDAAAAEQEQTQPRNDAGETVAAAPAQDDGAGSSEVGGAETAVAPEGAAPGSGPQQETASGAGSQQETATTPAGDGQTASDAAAPAREDAASAQPEAGEAGTDIAAAPPEQEPADGLTGAKLQRVDGAVIIRRGDSLWRISRRVYGMGVRYSTIYLANQDQISDPNRIWPGQVFSVPQATEEGEEADLEAMGEQSVSPDTESAIIRR